MNPTQLAAEAADSLWNDEWTDEDEKKFKTAATKHFKTAIEKAVDFYKRRCDALQQAQSDMRDPERQMVCDILANGYRDKIIEKSRATHASEIDPVSGYRYDQDIPKPICEMQQIRAAHESEQL